MRLLSFCALGLVYLSNAAPLVPGRAFDRLITIWLENQDFAKVSEDVNIKDLKKHGILLTRYYGNTHPSQPNYLAAVGGDYFGLNHGGFVRVPENVPWAGYFEDMPGPGYMGMGMGSDGKTRSGQWDYVRKHNPFVSFDSINMNGSRLLKLQSFDDFQRTFAARDVPQFVFMTPNMMNTGHNSTLKYVTDWSNKFLKPLLADEASDGRTLIMLTYDESETYEEPNRIVMLLLGSAVPPALKGTTDDTFYTHYSILSTVEHNWELPNLGRYDVPDNAASVNNSVSYLGALNDGLASFLPIPSPNVRLVGAGELPVLAKIRMAWMTHMTEQTPYNGSGNFVDGDENLPVYRPQVANQR
ncbi:putative acid phosphatase [Phialemonium atrogriseum]|uniref:Acid phosphatase n=1 Tax=Phialemonium atrogriseum TaxID=1093897 RepID=A0AAJ0CBQ4_9PEZI|nr:putative acid phosphatase [Phialemonium atrogriseum]KAK1772294.1 putative acid phosphatase [Phialemonium atrogriseum]